ncbi:MAG: hypothetical protein PWP71_2454 [Clostridia bacterium]|nr:hypothetical protein [Clostridia bacterium]
MNAQVLCTTKDMAREEWLKWRMKGIGGSDVAAIAGINRWKSAVEVWLEKTGQLESSEPGEAAYWGNQLEDLVAKEFEKRTGLKVRRRNAILQHPKYPFMLANIDRDIVGVKEGLECKTAGEYRKDEWKDDKVPDEYILQVQHYMAVCGYDAWWIAVLIGGNKFQYKRIERDEEIINYLIQIEKEFWGKYVVTKELPPVDGSQASTEILNKLYPDSVPESRIELPPSAQDLLDQYDKAKEQESYWKERKDEASNKLKELMGEHELGFVGERKISWKTIVSNRLDTKKFKKDHPDLFAQYAKESKSRRFEIR